MASIAKLSWRRNIGMLWWRGQSILWGVVVVGVAINLVSSWLITKQFDMSGTPLGWLLSHLGVFVGGSILLILQTIGAFWVVHHGRSSAPSSASLRLEQREQGVLRACGDIAQAQPVPQLPLVADLLQVLQNRYALQDIIDTLEYLEVRGDIEIFKVFGGIEASSFRMTPQGKRARALLV